MAACRSEKPVERPMARATRPWIAIGARLCLGLLPGLWMPLPAQASAVRLQIIGGFSALHQFRKQEEPFWRSEINRYSGGRIEADIRPLHQLGIPGSEMLPLMKSGVVSFGSILLSLHAGDDPELSAIDLPFLSPDIPTLRKTAAAFRPRLKQILEQRYNIELLGLYILPAQVIFCKKPFSGLGDLKGRRIRTSSVGQSEAVEALGAMPVKTTFAEIVPSITRGVVDCAITGTMSGNEIGLGAATTHMHSLAITWGVSAFGANRTAWDGLPSDIRGILTREVARFEERIWEAAHAETLNGIACNIGSSACSDGVPLRLTQVPHSEADEILRQRLLREVVLPLWAERCGSSCIEIWNQTIAPQHGLFITNDRRTMERQPGAQP